MTAHNLDEAMERLRKNHYPLWCVMVEVHCDPSLPERWRRAPAGSQEWRKSVQHEDALEVLRVSMDE